MGEDKKTLEQTLQSAKPYKKKNSADFQDFLNYHKEMQDSKTIDSENNIKKQHKNKEEAKWQELINKAINQEENEDDEDAFEFQKETEPECEVKEILPSKKEENTNEPQKPEVSARDNEILEEHDEPDIKEDQMLVQEPSKSNDSKYNPDEEASSADTTHTMENAEAPLENMEEEIQPEPDTDSCKQGETEKEEKLKTVDELLEMNKDVNSPMEFGKVIKAADLIKDEQFLEKGKTLKKKFNPNPPKEMIEGHDFNDPYLDGIYNYTYPEQIAQIRERKAEQRKAKIDAQREEEERREALKGKKKKKSAGKTSSAPAKKSSKPLKVPDRYPKVYEDPTDEEIDEKTGKPYHYFNFTKTIRNSKFRFLEKILPTAAIDDVLYDKGFLDGIADRQHDKSIRLNNMSPEEQYARDLRNMAVKILAAAAFVFAVGCKVVFDIIPDRKYDAAIQAMETLDYENAYYQFTELGTKDLSVYFAKYSEAKMLYKVGKYQEAKDAFTLLLPFDEDIFKKMNIRIEDEVSECSYQIALNYYYAGDFETAKNIFKEIHTYSDSTQRYYECGFQIAKDSYDDWQDTEDLKKSLKYFYRVRKYSTEDVSGYISNIQGQLYELANDAYRDKNYTEAIDIFSYLALFNYENEEDGINAKEMVFQCTYRHGLDLYRNRKYESARKVLSEIPEYKDSYVLAKECVYNIAHILYEHNPVASIPEYNKIIGYRDSNDMLYSPLLIMYGKWNITEMNDSSISPVEFRFLDDGQFRTGSQLMNIAISTESSPICYEWDGEKYVALDGQYSIMPEFDEDTNRMTITCRGPQQITKYKCQRKSTYEEMVYEMTEGNKTETAKETMNQKYQALIAGYIDKKLDHIVTMDGEDINIFEGNTD